MVSDSKLRRERAAPKTSRRYFDEQTKREAIEALLKGEKTRAELCKELDIQPSQLLAWMGQYGERVRAYKTVENDAAASAAAGIVGESLAATLGASMAAGLPGGSAGALGDEIAKAVGKAVLKLLAEQNR
jgi:transposase-like protein